MDVGGATSMSVILKIKDSPSYQELLANIRLQWLILVVFAILLFSLADTLLSSNEELKNDVLQQLSYSAKLEQIENTPYNEQQAEQDNKRLRSYLTKISAASSQSTAEAKALEEIEKVLSNKVQRMRLNLIGSESIEVGDMKVWNIRVDVSGRVREKSVIDLLALFEKNTSKWRVASLQYSPKTSGSISLVLDALFQESSGE